MSLFKEIILKMLTQMTSMLTSMDAAWRIFGYQTYPAPYPAVRLIKARLPRDVNFMLSEKKLTDIYVYFSRPEILSGLKYCEFFNLYDYCYNLTQRRFTNNPNAENDENGYFHLEENRQHKDFFIYKRLKPEDCITRMGGVSPDAGEICDICSLF